jgi:hypothetical protein
MCQSGATSMYCGCNTSKHHHHLIKCNLFSPWYNWKIANLWLTNDHSLYLCVCIYCKVYIHYEYKARNCYLTCYKRYICMYKEAMKISFYHFASWIPESLFWWLQAMTYMYSHTEIQWVIIVKCGRSRVRALTRSIQRLWNWYLLIHH